jgi:hypothetical protein
LTLIEFLAQEETLEQDEGTRALSEAPRPKNLFEGRKKVEK